METKSLIQTTTRRDGLSPSSTYSVQTAPDDLEELKEIKCESCEFENLHSAFNASESSFRHGKEALARSTQCLRAATTTHTDIDLSTQTLEIWLQNAIETGFRPAIKRVLAADAENVPAQQQQGSNRTRKGIHIPVGITGNTCLYHEMTLMLKSHVDRVTETLHQIVAVQRTELESTRRSLEIVQERNQKLEEEYQKLWQGNTLEPTVQNLPRFSDVFTQDQYPIALSGQHTYRHGRSDNESLTTLSYKQHRVLPMPVAQAGLHSTCGGSIPYRSDESSPVARFDARRALPTTTTPIESSGMRFSYTCNLTGCSARIAGKDMVYMMIQHWRARHQDVGIKGIVMPCMVLACTKMFCGVTAGEDMRHHLGHSHSVLIAQRVFCTYTSCNFSTPYPIIGYQRHYISMHEKDGCISCPSPLCEKSFDGPDPVSEYASHWRVQHESSTVLQKPESRKRKHTEVVQPRKRTK